MKLVGLVRRRALRAVDHHFYRDPGPAVVMAIILFVGCGIVGAILGLLLVTMLSAIGFAAAEDPSSFTGAVMGRLSEGSGDSSAA